MTYSQQVTVDLLDTDGTTVISGDPLEKAYDVSFMDELSGPGTGSCVIPISEAGAAEATPGRFVRVFVGGTHRFTFKIEGDPEYLIVGEEEEAEAVIRVNGRGNGCILDQTVVVPSASLELDLDSSWRLFSFASPNFPNDASWVSADELYEYLDGVTYGKRYQVATDGLPYPSPISFPVPTSPEFYDSDSPPGADYENVYWIWVPGEEESSGYGFFRRSLTIATDGVYVFAVTADNFFTMFLEGVPILGEQTDHFIWRGWKEVPIFLPAGTYTVGVAVENYGAGGPTNPAGLIATVHTVNGNGIPNSVQLVTDDSWDCIHDEDIWPGWTPGQIANQLLDESEGRGALAALGTRTFAALTDSASNAWADAQDGSPYIPAFATDVGGTVMAAFNKMKAEGHIEWHMQPDFDLDIWGPDSIGASSGVELEVGVNLRSLVRGATAVYANALLVQYEGGEVWVTDAAAISAHGDRVEDIFASEASTREEAIRQGNVELSRRVGSGWPAIIAEIEPTSSADAPYQGFNLGELVEHPAVGGGTEETMVLSISLTTDDDGFAKWRCEMNRRWRSTVRQNYELLRELGGRSGYTWGAAR